MGCSRFWLKVADEYSKSTPHEFPRSHWLKATGQRVIERYLSATMKPIDIDWFSIISICKRFMHVTNKIALLNFFKNVDNLKGTERHPTPGLVVYIQ